MATLETRIVALERRHVPAGRPSVYVRCISAESDPEDVKRARETEARAAYVALNGEPRGGVGVIHNIIVVPKTTQGTAHA